MPDLKLYPFQRVGVDFLKSRKRAGIFDDQGVGKTIQIIVAAKELKLKKILVIVKASLRIQWQREFRKWYSACNPVIYSYNYIQDESRAIVLSLKEWDLVIADECQEVNHWESSQCRNFCLEVIKNAKYVWLASGTPVTQSAKNWHPLLSVLEPGKWGKYGDFCNIYCYEKFTTISYKRGGVTKQKKIKSFVGFKNNEALAKAVKNVSIRRLKEDIEVEFPTKFYNELFVEVDIQLISNLTVKDYKIVESCIHTGTPIPEHISKVREAIGLSKVSKCLDWLSTQDKPVIIFTWHLSVAESLVTELNKKSSFSAMITGKTGLSLRQHIVDSFEKGEIRFLVISIAAGGTGLNLPFADRCIFLEKPWSPHLVLQAEDRISRITSKHKSIFITSMVGLGSIDEVVEKALKHKQVGMESVING